MSQILSTSYVLDAESYVQLGGPRVDWDAFRALGGETCNITPSWIHGEPVGGIYMLVVGTAAATALVDASLVVL